MIKGKLKLSALYCLCGALLEAVLTTFVMTFHYHYLYNMMPHCEPNQKQINKLTWHCSAHLTERIKYNSKQRQNNAQTMQLCFMSYLIDLSFQYSYDTWMSYFVNCLFPQLLSPCHFAHISCGRDLDIRRANKVVEDVQKLERGACGSPCVLSGRG